MNRHTLLFSRSFLILVLIGLLVPLYPLMPTAGLDPSWSFAMSYALKTDLTIGKDLIFTFGPYVYLYTKIYMPNTDWPSLIIGGYLVFSYFFSLKIILNNKESMVKNTVLVSIGLGFFVFYMDVIYLIYPVLAILALLVYIEKIVDVEINETLLVTVLFTPFGVLSLIKGSFFIVCFMFYALSAVYLWLNKRHLILISAVCVFPISIIVAWLISGEPIVGMYYYFANLLPVVSGYTSAMSVTGYLHDIILYLLVSIVLIFGIYKSAGLSFYGRHFLLVVASGYLLLVFKAGLVRHDIHAIISANILFFFCFLLSLILQDKSKYKIYIKFSILVSFVGLFLSTATYSFIPNSSMAFIKGLSGKSIEKSQIKMMNIQDIASLIYTNFSTLEIISTTAGSTYEKFNNYAPPLSALVGLYVRVFESEKLNYEYNQAIDAIKSHYNIPLLSGTSDIYSYGQSYLIASGNQWNPRPIFQGYSVYTRWLAEKNRQHLLDSNAPDNIFLKVETIDYRLPSMDDGASWPVLLTHYDLVDMHKDLLILKKKSLTPIWKENLTIKDESYQLGQMVTVPSQEQVVIAEFSVKQTILGKLMNFLYKPDELVIVVTLENGENKAFRFVPGETELGIILSPLIESTNEFSYFYGDRTKLAGKRVISFSILEAHNRLHWEQQYHVAFKSLATADKANGQP